jgi:hypothetical protein
MIALISDHGDAQRGWQLVGRTGFSADVLARAGAAPAPVSCRQALEQLRDGEGALTVLDTPDGHLPWQLTGPDGGVIAESPPVYRDAVTCRVAFTDARRAAHTALGGLRPSPAAGNSPPTAPNRAGR